MSKRARETEDEVLIISDSDSETGKSTSAKPANRCPVLGRTFEQDLVQLHVQHFEEEQEASCSTSQGNEGTVLCSSGCGALLNPWEVADHTAAHRLQDEQLSEVSASPEDKKREQAHFKALQSMHGFSNASSGVCSLCHERNHDQQGCPHAPHNVRATERVVEARHSVVVAAQQEQQFQRIKAGMSLLRKCLEQNTRPGYSAALCGKVHHLQSEGADSGWGCGWRNMQMLTSHLLTQDEATKAALFDGCGFIPDISSLQAWLEVAWAAGYDVMGREQLGGSVQGSRKWVGTTECAALFRYFGLKAQVVEFKAKSRPIIRKNPAGQDIHFEVVCDGCNACPMVGIRFRSLTLPDHDLCEQCHSKPCSTLAAPFERVTSGADAGGSTRGSLPEALNRKLAMWVWHYFTGEALPGFQPWGSQCQPPAQLLLRSSPVLLSGKPPLYFQHQGHSRTIIGIEQYRKPNGSEAELTLLVLDPSTRTQKLSAALKNQNGWQQQLRRGLKSLGNKDHQLLYVEAGLIVKQDCNAWKNIRPVQVFQ